MNIRPTKTLAAVALLACLLIAPAAHAQAPTPVPTPAATPAISGPAGMYTYTVTLANPGPVAMPGIWSGPSGTYTITLPVGSVVATSDNSITITWGPGVVAPALPVVTPVITPVAPPTTVVAPPTPSPALPPAVTPTPVPSPAPVVAPATPVAPVAPAVQAAPQAAPQATPQLSPAVHAANVQAAAQAVHPAAPVAQPPAVFNVAVVTDRNATAPLPPALVALKNSATIVPALRAINSQNQWAVLDASDPRVAAWAASVHAAAPPYILVFKPNGDALTKVESLPATTDEGGLIAEVKRLAAGGPSR